MHLLFIQKPLIIKLVSILNLNQIALTQGQAQGIETSSVNNPWKVRLDNSTEGKGTIASFWLGTYNKNKNAVQGSTIMNVKQGAKTRYCGAYKVANKNTTYLAAENNNYNSKTYYVDGIWDEETW